MKKLLTLVLLALFSVALTSCSMNDANKQPAAETVEEESSATEEATEAKVEATEAQAEADKAKIDAKAAQTEANIKEKAAH